MKRTLTRATYPLWTGAAIVCSVLVCLALTFLHFEHERVLGNAMAELQDLRQARAELAKGYLHVVLSDSPGSPFDRVEGSTLLRQAIDSIQDSVREKDSLDSELIATFRNQVGNFEGLLLAWERGGADNNLLAVDLRVSFHQLERLADEIDAGVHADLQKLGDSLRGTFVLFLSGAILLLACICWMLLAMVRARARSERALSVSEERWRFAIEGADDGLWDWNATTGEVYFSPIWKAMLGYSDREIKNQLEEWSSRVHPDDLPGVMEVLQAHLDGTAPQYESEHRLRCKDGSYKWILDRGKVMSRDLDGMPLRVIGTHTDISSIKAVEQQLRESEERFRGLAEEAPDSIFIQANGKFVYMNKACSALLGLPVEEALGQPVLDWFHPDYRDRVNERIEALHESREALPLAEELMLHADGVVVPVEVSAIPFTYNHERGALVFVRNISNRKMAEAERDKLQAQLLHSQKMESVGRLAGGVAHDFNNMLSVINGYAELLLENLPDDSPLRVDAQQILTAGGRAAALTRQLLAFSRKQVLNPEVLDTNKVIDEVARMLSRVIEETISVKLELAPDLKQVCIDAAQLEQALANLVINARDAMPHGGKLTIRTQNALVDESFTSQRIAVEPGEYVMISIADTGIGMDEATVSRIFEPFFTTKEKDKGTGLGLAIVYGFMKQSGGAIWVYSEPGRGTTFKIYLPVCDAPEVEAVTTKGRLNLQGSGRILLAEDEDLVRELATGILTRAGYEVLATSSGEEALERWRNAELPIDLLLTDLVMPGMNGVELARKIRAERPDTRILFMSGYAENALLDDSVLSLNDYIAKPFAMADLLSKIGAAMENKEDTGND